MSASLLPSSRVLVAYWLNCELTTGGGFACPPLADVATLRRADGSPQASVVPLFAASFAGTTDDFAAPYFTLPASVQAALTDGSVARLQAAGIRVTLSVLGNGAPDGMGWSCIPTDGAAAFAEWVATEVVGRYGLDGIDVDDEFAGCTAGSPAQLVAAVAALRTAMPDKIISKALWNDQDAFRGTALGELLTYGATMAYGWDASQMKSMVEDYVELGLPAAKICIGVQAGPEQAGWMTSIGTTQALTRWSAANGLLGMMLYSYSQDIAQFTAWPQKTQPYPSPDDHQWQAAILQAWGQGVPTGTR